MTFRVEYQIDGIGEVTHDLLGMAARAAEPAPILHGIAEALRKTEARLFEEEGGGHWPPLAGSTIAAKGNSRILVETGALMRSLTEDGAGHVEHVGGDELVFGTTDPKAKWHRSGTSRMPKRDPLFLREGDVKELSRAIQAWLMGAERAEFGVQSFGLGALDPFGL
jgi:phage gpG-like protein